MITPFNIFVGAGGGLLVPYKEKIMWLPHSTWVDTGDDDGDDDDEDNDDDGGDDDDGWWWW